jgi:hypothetical protein
MTDCELLRIDKKDIPCQQVRYEQIRERAFPVKRKHHCPFGAVAAGFVSVKSDSGKAAAGLAATTRSRPALADVAVVGYG